MVISVLSFNSPLDHSTMVINFQLTPSPFFFAAATTVSAFDGRQISRPLSAVAYRFSISFSRADRILPRRLCYFIVLLPDKGTVAPFVGNASCFSLVPTRVPSNTRSSTRLFRFRDSQRNGNDPRSAATAVNAPR